MSSPPGPAPSKAREERVKRALARPDYFLQAYFAPYDPNWQDNLIAPFAVEMLRFYAALPGWPYAGGVVMMPPEFMKTTLISQGIPLWETVRSRIFGTLLRGLLLSEEEDMAKGNLAVLKWHIENNERLASDFVDGLGRPLLVPDPDMQEWNEGAIIVSRPGLVSRDPTWQAKGLDSKGITGRRLTLVIGDDVVTARNAGSPALRKSALDTIELQVQTRIVEGGKFVIGGNFNDSKDLLSTLAARERWHLFKRPSIHRPGNPAEPPREADLFDPAKARFTWPEVWGPERLKVEHRDNPTRFRRIHLLDPRGEQGSRLQTGWVTRLPDELGAAVLKYARMFITVDPAPGGEGDDLDYFTITVGALSAGHLDVVQSFAFRADTTRQVNMLGQMHDAFAQVGAGVVAIGGAKHTLDAYFRGAFKIVRPDLAHKLHDVSIPQSEASKEVRLEGLGPRAQSGWLRVWESAWDRLTSDLLDQAQELTLAEEWREFPYGNHDDRLDSLEILCRTADDLSFVGELTHELNVAEA